MPYIQVLTDSHQFLVAESESEVRSLLHFLQYHPLNIIFKNDTIWDIFYTHIARRIYVCLSLCISSPD